MDSSIEEGAYQFAEIVDRAKEPICLNGKSGRGGVAGLQPSLQDRIYSINGKHTAVTTAFMPKIAEPIRIGTILTPPASAKHDSQWRRVYSINGKSATLCANGGGGGAKTGLYLCPTTNTKQPNIYEVKDGVVNYKGEAHAIDLEDGFYVIRTATPLECERLQTLPDNYTAVVSNVQRYKGLGNGWTAEVIIHILNGVLKDVPRDEEIVVLSMYDGIGTGRYCLDKMGFTNVRYYAYEIDKYAKQVAMSNYPDIIQMGDAFDLRHPDWTIGY
jgi:DNA (cytosine-5)-methyltransferase 3A